MIEIKDVETFGFEAAIRGMRNPYMSHDKSDSVWCSEWVRSSICKDCRYSDKDLPICLYPYNNITNGGNHFVIGEADLALAKKLIKAGPEHRKFLRMIHVQCDVLAPRYWWAEMDKYKWVEANSSSTMHLITKHHLTMDDFSWKDQHNGMYHKIIEEINWWIDAYNNKMDNMPKDAESAKKFKDDCLTIIKGYLPESFNQLRTIDTNYEALISIHHQRRNHRLTEWREFCTWIENLPYMDEFLEVKDAD